MALGKSAKTQEVTSMSTPITRTITVHTGGTCIGNPGPGSWAVIIEGDNGRLSFAKRVAQTTNQRMELTAAIEALRALQKCKDWSIRLVSDSQYLVNGMTSWLHTWKLRAWKGAKGKPILNQDLWFQLDELSQQLSVTWDWCSGRAGNRCDGLLQRAMTEGSVRSELKACKE